MGGCNLKNCDFIKFKMVASLPLLYAQYFVNRVRWPDHYTIKQNVKFHGRIHPEKLKLDQKFKIAIYRLLLHSICLISFKPCSWHAAFRRSHVILHMRHVALHDRHVLIFWKPHPLWSIVTSHLTLAPAVADIVCDGAHGWPRSEILANVGLHSGYHWRCGWVLLIILIRGGGILEIPKLGACHAILGAPNDRCHHAPSEYHMKHGMLDNYTIAIKQNVSSQGGCNLKYFDFIKFKMVTYLPLFILICLTFVNRAKSCKWPVHYYLTKCEVSGEDASWKI